MAKNKEEKHTKEAKPEKMKKSVLWTRIICIALAILMVSGGIFTIIEAFAH